MAGMQPRRPSYPSASGLLTGGAGALARPPSASGLLSGLAAASSQQQQQYSQVQPAGASTIAARRGSSHAEPAPLAGGGGGVSASIYAAYAHLPSSSAGASASAFSSSTSSSASASASATSSSASASAVSDRMRAVTEQAAGGCFTLAGADDSTYLSALKSDIFQLQMSLDRMSSGGGGGPHSPKAPAANAAGAGAPPSRGASRLRAEINSIKQGSNEIETLLRDADGVDPTTVKLRLMEYAFSDVFGCPSHNYIGLVSCALFVFACLKFRLCAFVFGDFRPGF
jgi:hypothetical protein